MGAVYNGYMFNGGLTARLQEITDFTWSWSYTAGAQWITADLSNYEWVVLSFIPNGTTAHYRIRHYWAIPINGDDVGVSWRYSESPSSSTTYSYAACAHVYATSNGIYLRSIKYDKTVYLQPGSETVQLFSVSCGNKVSPVHIPYGCELPIYNGIATNGYAISLPYTINSDYDVYIDFTVNSYVNNTPVLGNSRGGGYLHLTMFNNRWYASAGNNSEVNFAGTITGRHNFRVNANGGYFDGSRVMNYTPTTANYTIYLAQRAGTSSIFNGIIHEFKITSISTGEVICDYVPAQILSASGLYDKANNVFLPWVHSSLSGSVVDTVHLTELPTLPY